MPSRITEEPVVKKVKTAKKKKSKKVGSKKTPKKKKGKKEGPKSFADRLDKIRGRYAKPIVIYEDDVEPPRWHTRFVRLNRLLGHGGIKKGAIIEVYGWEDSGKAQPLDARILTPSGFRAMGDLKVGHHVIGINGRSTKVVGVYPQGQKEIYKVTTSDGGSTECCEEHLWFTRTLYECERGQPGKVRSLAEIKETLRRGKNPNHRVPLVSPVEFHVGLSPLPLDPYLLGLLIGDGSFRPHQIVFSNSEPDVLEALIDKLPEGDFGTIYEGHSCLNVKIKKGQVGRDPSATIQALRDLGLGAKLSLEKFIPVAYLTAGIEQRRRLLQGLMDTDGTVDKPGQPGVSFATSSSVLRDNVVFLARSLGAIVKTSSKIPSYTYRGQKRTGHEAYRVMIQFPDGWCPVSSEKHLARWKAPVLTRHRRIVGIERLGFKEAQCIKVEAEDGLYVTDDFLVTHNTSLAIALAADIQRQAPEGKNRVVMLNYEMPHDFKWWRVLGLNTAKTHFAMIQPKTLEEGMADMVDLLESGEVCCVIIDSVYAASAKGSRKVMEHWGDPKKGGGTGGGIGVEARQWGAAWTATKGLFVEHDAVCIAVNQLRVKIDMGGGKPKKGYGGPSTTTPRGHALKFYAWVRIELKGGVLVDGENSMRTDVDGRRVKIRIIKNKTSDEAKGIAFYDLIRGDGFDLTQEVIDLALEFNVITHNGGGHYVCWNGKKIHGKAKLREWIEFTPKVKDVLVRAVEKYLERQEVEEEDEDDFGDEE